MAASPTILKDLYGRGLSPSEAYKTFREDGGKQRKQDFLNAYRVITQKPRAAYNIGGAKRADVKKPKVEKYEKKKAKKAVKAKEAKTKTPAKKRSASHGKKHKRGGIASAEHFEGDEPAPPKKSAKRTGLDISAHFTAGSPDLKKIKAELARHGIKFFGGKDRRELVLAKDKESGNIHLYGTAVYDGSRDKGEKVVGIARELLNKTLKRLGQATL